MLCIFHHRARGVQTVHSGKVFFLFMHITRALQTNRQHGKVISTTLAKTYRLTVCIRVHTVRQLLT